jgi:hypothetical protein
VKQQNTEEIMNINRDLKTNRSIDHKKAFDSWRLYQYFEFINCSKISWASNTYVANDDDDLDKLLEFLSKANIVRLVQNQDKL